MQKEKIFVTKPFMTDMNEYNEYFKQIFDNIILTNQGPLLKELEDKLSNYLNVNNLHYVTNGTIALQIALKALDIEDGEIITTPFSYVATTSSILWERCTPVFADIEENNFMINPDNIERSITKNTKAIMAVNVFGYVCDFKKIQTIADKYNLKVIYDSAHCFGSKYNGRSVLDYGDISTCSFHATKLFHTVEGGCCVIKDKEVSNKLELIKRFGHNYDNHITLGINAKQSEFHSAIGLVNLKYIDYIINERKKISQLYDKLLDGVVVLPKKQENLEYNYAYYPVLFKSEDELLKVFKKLSDNNIYPRRYFYPSLNKLPYLKTSQSCPVSENISLRIACLPLYVGLEEENIIKICNIIKKEVNI